ncbi:hypothetical protein VRK_33650 [Vibrio sp. MEBiC08052]|nr:hypothetical protein VRK_33650 [Vibrio sp. MEBiC08052]
MGAGGWEDKTCDAGVWGEKWWLCGLGRNYFSDLIAISECAPDTFSRPKKYPKRPRFKFSTHNQDRVDSHPAQAILKIRPEFSP